MSFSTQAGQYPATQTNASTYAGASQANGQVRSRIDGAFRSTSAYSSSWRNQQIAGSGNTYSPQGGIHTVSGKTYCPQDYLQASGQLVARATGSFMQMNAEVVHGAIEEMNTVEEVKGLQRIKRPNTDPIGQVTPVGDAMLPLLFCAAVYCLIKRLRLKSIKN